MLAGKVGGVSGTRSVVACARRFEAFLSISGIYDATIDVSLDAVDAGDVLLSCAGMEDSVAEGATLVGEEGGETGSKLPDANKGAEEDETAGETGGACGAEGSTMRPK